jgi:hypothetical protein
MKQPAWAAELLESVPSYHRHIGGELPLDRWIGYAVKVLRDAGIDTYESCQGGPGHAFPDATIRFTGPRETGLRAVAAALECGLPVYALRRFWRVQDGELTGPDWEIVFHPLAKLKARQLAAERSGLLGALTGQGP